MSDEKAMASKGTTKKIDAATGATKAKKSAVASKVVSSTAEQRVSRANGTGVAVHAKPDAKASGTLKSVTAQSEIKINKQAPNAHASTHQPIAPSQEERERWIAVAAYHRAERRGFVPGYEVQDWLDAEADINRLID
jgi:hypothetical protein